jgi:hypothetical protein
VPLANKKFNQLAKMLPLNLGEFILPKKIEQTEAPFSQSISPDYLIKPPCVYAG